ncbi:MAG: 2-succinyl-5-enolpyruvyl-6-hydroxy-3-cyclohexene-1-carboxylic-acid synthase [Acidimicrobiales bacterium]
MPADPRPQDVQATFAATLVDEWVRGGLRAAVVCPGSRSTPLALAFADHPEVAVHVHHDERSGAFVALGLALASGRAVAVLTTSGTAAVELHPAVVEAHHAGVSLLVCSADRPAELRDVGAPQTIDQTGLYGGAVRWFADPGVADVAGRVHWRAFAARALVEAHGPPAGPVHLNLPFREPLVGVAGDLPAGRGDGPWTTAETASHAGGPIDRLRGRRGVILAGHPGPRPGDLWVVAEALGWPVVPDPRSSAWALSAATVLHLDAILRSDRAREVLRPEVIVRLGAPPASRVVNEWCAASGADEIVVAGGRWSDPSGTAATVLPGSPSEVIAVLAKALVPASERRATPGEWLGLWRSVSDAASTALQAALRALPLVPNEPAAARDMVAALPDGARLVVSSSMPIRDVERYAEPRTAVRVLANRGANGIDGVVSTAVGVALDGRPTGLLIGDLAFLHDSNGLLGVADRSVDLVVVVVDNDGGGIFSFLPQARSLGGDRFETLFGTPHRLDLVALAHAYGVPARPVEGDVAKAVAEAADEGGVHVLVARTDRAANVEVHRVLDDAVAAAVDSVLVARTA